VALADLITHPAASGRWLGWQFVLRFRRRMSLFRFSDRLPWSVWLRLCGWDAAVIAEAIGRFSDPGLTVVQVGANDGLLHDPVHALVAERGWKGVLIEPVPSIFEALLQNYSGADGLSFENAAIGATDGTMPIYYVTPRDGDPDFLRALASFDRTVLESHAWAVPDIAERVQQLNVPTLRLATLVERYEITLIDLFVSDTEGYDYEILKQIDFDAPWAPRFIIFEAKHLDRATLHEAKRRLRRSGYKWLSTWQDVFAYRETPQGARPPPTSRSAPAGLMPPG
jgi:FkbM family methyltransferase